ncbi:BFAR [Symbiodinium necroappetens]|uniref:BFAR protein n=1 Tax=Symbiodinium necroappetens TaxID=1628268 RepID=A0A812SML7_9DINO|nr:BFAR [Symbiodinium necroappetens]
MHSLKTAGCCTFVSEISGVVPGQTWLWADDEETVAAFDDAACALLKRLPSKLRNQLMLYTASLTIIPHSVHEDASKWHVDWYGIPDALSWTMLVPLWPRDDDDWRALGGTQLCLKEHALPRADSVAPSIAAVAALVAKEAAEQNPNECPEHWASADFSVVEHSYQRGECLLFEGHVLHRTGPYEAENPATRVLASLMVGPRDPRHWPEVSRSLCKQGACFVRKPCKSEWSAASRERNGSSEKRVTLHPAAQGFVLALNLSRPCSLAWSNLSLQPFCGPELLVPRLSVPDEWKLESDSDDEVFVWSETDKIMRVLRNRRRCRKHPVCWLFVIALAVILGPLVVALRDSSMPKGTANWISDRLSKPFGKPTDPVADTSLALLIGFSKQQVVQSSVLVDIAFGLVLSGTLTATVLATLEPDAQSVPRDFLQKATLSNMTQDMTQPQGRLWSTALGLASVLSVISMYTFWLYRSWAPYVDNDNPIHSIVLETALERRLRIAWALVPQVGFVLAAMVPSLSDVAGYEVVLTAVHNVSAPFAMLFLMIMETIQLGFGENAFQYFFTDEATPVHGPLTKYQRMRVCLLIEAWIAGLIFIGVHSRSALVETAAVLPLIYQSRINSTIAQLSHQLAEQVANGLDEAGKTRHRQGGGELGLRRCAVVESLSGFAEVPSKAKNARTKDFTEVSGRKVRKGSVATMPLDVARHAVQAAISSKRPHPGLVEAFRAAASPPSGFFRGLVPALICSAAGPAAFLLGYEVQRGSKEVLEAGLVAKAVQVAVVQPFDFFRTSWQAALLLPETKSSHLLRGPWEVITTDGPRSLWRGLIPTLLRDVLAAGTFWSSYMYLNQVMLNDSSLEEVLLDPVTLPCCGESFCKTCLQQWTVVKLDDGAEHASELAERRRDIRDQELEERIAGGFGLWQEVAASRDLFVGENLAVAFGTSGVVLGRHEEGRVKVKFDLFLWGISGVFNVSPDEILPQLPSTFGVSIGQRVLASQDLIVASSVRVPFATLGTVVGPSSSPDRITVCFDTVTDGQNRLDVQAFEILPNMELIGGFRVAQRVTAVENILLEGVVLVPPGAVGTVLSQYSDTRLTVMFEGRLDGRSEEFDAAAMRQRAVQSAFVSSVCAMGAAIVTQPLDMVKTKMQIHRMMTSRDDGFRRVKVARFAATLRETYQATGWRGLWAGGSLRLACGAVAGLLLGPALEYAQLLSHDAARPLRRQLDLGEDPGRTIVHPRSSKAMFIDVKL